MNENRATLRGVYSACLVAVLMALLVADAPGAEPRAAVTIAAPGSPPVIVTPAEMEDQLQRAVADLQLYLQKITGLQIEVVQGDPAGKFAILVGDVPANADLQPVIEQEQLGREGFVLDIAPQRVRIVGGSKFGTAYGVYEFLERLGVRWLFPGQWGEVVPRAATVSLPACRFTDKPGFLIRRMAVNYYYDPRLYKYDRALYPQVNQDAQADARAAAEAVGAWKRRNRQNTSGFFGHSHLIPPQKYGQEHPEWFAQIDGRRELDPGNWKLCHANQGMVQQAIQDVLADIRRRKADKKPQVDDGFQHLLADYFIISVSPTDGGGFCRCDDCLKMGAISDRLQIFANQIADAVRQEFPDYWVGYYGAYSEAQMPPTVKAHPGVMVFLTNYTRSFFYDLTETANTPFREKLTAWMPACPNRATADFDGIPEWWGFGPLSYVAVHKVDYPWYSAHGIRGISTHASIGWAATGYSSYITGKMWWHPDADVEALRRDFVESAFGEAFAPMWRYHERLDKARVYPSPQVRYAMRKDLDEAVGLARREDVKVRLDYLRAYDVLWDTFTNFQAGKVTPEELQRAIRLARSIEYSVTPLRAFMFARMPGAPTDELGPYTPEELHRVLNGVALEEPGEELPTWSDGDDLRLVPLAATSTAEAQTVSPDMGANFRYGPTTMLIQARANERIQVTQEGKFTRTEYELLGPEQTVIEKGASEEPTILDRAATTDGVYTLVLYTAASTPRIRVANRAAAVKASSSLQCVQPYGKATFYFYVPRGTRQFAVVTRPQSQLTVELWGPHDAALPAQPPITQAAKIFEEHRITVPPGADGAVWRVQFSGETNMVYLQGIPPFLAGAPDRGLRLPER